MKELIEQNKSLEENVLKTRNEYREIGQQIVVYKWKYGIKGRYSIFDSLTAK